MLVVAYAEGPQLLITLVYIRVAATRKIAAMDVRSSQRVADALAGIKIRIQDLLLFSLLDGDGSRTALVDTFCWARTILNFGSVRTYHVVGRKS